MKIAFLLYSLDGGGTERASLTLANGLAKRGHSITLLLITRTGVLLDKVDPAVTIVGFGKLRAINCLARLCAYLRTERPEVLFTALPTINVIGITAKLLAGGDTAVIPVEHMPVSIDARENEYIEPKVAYALYPLFYRAAARIVTNCDEARDDFIRTYPSLPASRVRRIYNPVITDEILSLAQAPAEPAWFTTNSDTRPIIVGAGRLVRQKNFDLLLQAFAAVRQQLPCRLLIMGTGEDQHKLERLAQQLGLTDDLLMPGFVRNPYACMARSNLFVLSSRYETLPTVTIEALACGLPVVATPCVGVREILADGRYGTVLSGYGLGELTTAIVAALKNPTPRAVVMQRAQEFSAKQSVDEYSRLLEEVGAGKLTRRPGLN
jgi:glycosyltransferase involved in cell wall biosynthesis